MLELHPCVTFPQLTFFADRFVDLTGGEKWVQTMKLKLRAGGGDRLLDSSCLPRAGDPVLGWCRECGGPVTGRDRAKVFLKNLSFYGDKWRDEGTICFKQSRWVCGGCGTARLDQHGTSRAAWSQPARGEVLLAVSGEAAKITALEAVRRLAAGDIGPPFALVFGLPGGVGTNPEHYYRFVPVNWSVGAYVDVYLAGAGRYGPLRFRPAAVLAAAEKAAAELGRLVGGDGGRKPGRKKLLEEVFSGTKLFPAERLVAELVLVSASPAPAKK